MRIHSRRPRHALRRPRPDGDRGSLPMAMLLSLVGVSLSGLMLPMLMAQIAGARVDNARVHALTAAQTGLDVGLAHIRAANDGKGNGVLTALPCAPFTGTVGTATYQVSIAYQRLDASGNPTSDTCVAGYGAVATPTKAVLTSVGTDLSGTTATSRQLQATYTFRISNANVSGGLIHTTGSGGVDLCLDAGSTSPSASTQVALQPCVPGSGRQAFSYNRNLTLSLGASGKCLDAGSPQKAGAAVKFATCATTGSALIEQQWSFYDDASFRGTTDGINIDNFCFYASPAAAGSFVTLNSTGSACTAFSPDSTVGAGMAGPPLTSQLVDYQQFGRCLDVTEQNVSKGFLIAWPCKQSPDPSKLTWNQLWTTPTIPANATSASGAIYTVHSGTKYCLKSPGSTAYAQYVTLVTCTGTATSQSISWTVYSNTGNNTTKYRIVDGYGYCLQPRDPTISPSDLYGTGTVVSKIQVGTCSDSLLQKWNADPSTGMARGLGNYAEQAPGH